VKNPGWIGVDLDRTLAHYDKWEGAGVIGPPIPKMLARVKQWLEDGEEVRIVTARVSSDGTLARDCEVLEAGMGIQNWCIEHLGVVLPVTCEKDFDMRELWDDRAVQVVPNEGSRVDGRE
jgi:hypothetical protein